MVIVYKGLCLVSEMMEINWLWKLITNHWEMFLSYLQVIHTLRLSH